MFLRKYLSKTNAQKKQEEKKEKSNHVQYFIF